MSHSSKATKTNTEVFIKSATVSLNTTIDQIISLGNNYEITRAVITVPSDTIQSAQGGIYSGANKTRIVYVEATQSYVMEQGDLIELVIAKPQWASSVVFSLTTAEGSAAQATLILYGRPLKR